MMKNTKYDLDGFDQFAFSFISSTFIIKKIFFTFSWEMKTHKIFIYPIDSFHFSSKLDIYFHMLLFLFCNCLERKMKTPRQKMPDMIQKKIDYSSIIKLLSKIKLFQHPF